MQKNMLRSWNIDGSAPSIPMALLAGANIVVAQGGRTWHYAHVRRLEQQVGPEALDVPVWRLAFMRHLAQPVRRRSRRLSNPGQSHPG